MSIINPDNIVWGSYPNVLIRDSETYSSAEIINISGTVLGTYTSKLNQPKAKEPTPEVLFILPSIHISSVRREDDGSITVTGSFDVEFNFISWDLFEFEQNFSI